jgi:hypothetical protein
LALANGLLMKIDKALAKTGKNNQASGFILEGYLVY